MVQYLITAWRTRSELLEVRAHLYPETTQQAHNDDDERKLRDAVARVGVWVRRGNCPHLIESTALLARAALNDRPGNDAFCVRAAYAAAFCRFVTGLLDSHQDKRHKLSMYTIAKTLQLPESYVSLRHQATHEELPSIEKLRLATHQARQWIWAHYWAHLDSQSKIEAEAEIETECQDKSKTKFNTKIECESSCDAIVARILHNNYNDDDDAIYCALREFRLQADDVVHALADVVSYVRDPVVVRRALRLQARMVSGDEGEGEGHGQGQGEGQGQHKDGDGQRSSVELVRAEILEMDGRLDLDASEEERYRCDDDDDDNKEQRNDRAAPPLSLSPQSEPDSEPEPRAWTPWEGLWLPKPIGIV